ncbi:MAG: HAMP domain-containing protein [Candidatus Krumholzibacteriota bacterium]|nr:HAMP domain-containing protein [Candidatus Krumholzibacteriota bacterium]
MQRRLFLLFLLFALLPAAVFLVVDWQLSRRHLAYLDSPGLAQALESSLSLARRALDAEKAAAAGEAARLAARLAGGETPPAPPGGAWRLRGPAAGPAGDGAPDAGPAPLLALLAEQAVPAAPERLATTDGHWLLAAAPLPGGGHLLLLRPLDAGLAGTLDAVARGGRRHRQLQLYYGELLRSDTLLTLAAVLVLLLLAALWLSRRLARQLGGPLRELVRGTERVAAGDLDHRVAAGAPAELGELVAAFNAMTERLARSQAELRRAERVAAWQGIARRLAHEIKNPLTPINLALHRIRTRSEEPVVVESITAALEETGNLQRLADEFSLFARLPAPARRRVDLVELLRGQAELYAGGGAMEVVWEGWPDSLILEADPGLLRQAFGNLLKNAAEAMAGRGRLVLGLARPAPGRVAVSLADSGPGLPRPAEELFEPTVSTKATGSGLGLAIARRIVEEHGGRLEAETAPAGGAVFRVTLPAGGDVHGSPGAGPDRTGGAAPPETEEVS